jgi:hypothetical protein
MALSKTITTVHGFEAVDAYHRVEAVSLVGKDQISFHVRSYAATDKPFFQEQTLITPYDLNGANPIKQAYEYVKTLEEFTDAKDC